MFGLEAGGSGELAGWEDGGCRLGWGPWTGCGLGRTAPGGLAGWSGRVVRLEMRAWEGGAGALVSVCGGQALLSSEGCWGLGWGRFFRGLAGWVEEVEGAKEGLGFSSSSWLRS